MPYKTRSLRAFPKYTKKSLRMQVGSCLGVLSCRKRLPKYRYIARIEDTQIGQDAL